VTKTKDINQIIDEIEKLNAPAVIVISGFGGAGKSSFSNILSKSLNAPIISIDSFFKDRTMQDYSFWNILDYDRFKNEILIPFTQNQNPIHYGHFDYMANKIGEIKELKHDGRLIIEGVGLFRPELLQYFSYKIWIDCPMDEAINRGKTRDRNEYDNPQDEFWDGIWRKNDLECFEAYNPKDIADAIIDNSKREY
jgi:uridine kinase